MRLLKRIESFNRIVIYTILKLFIRNKKVQLPLKCSYIKKILIFRYDVLGDMIVTMPAFDFLRSNVHGAEIHVLASKKNKFLIQEDPRINKIYIWQRRFFKDIRTLFKMRKERYDLILPFVFASTSIPGILSNIIGGKRAVKVALAHSKRENLYRTFYNIMLPVNKLMGKITMVEFQVSYLSELFGIDFNPGNVNLNIQIKQKYFDIANRFISDTSLRQSEFFIYNISAGKSYRTISAEKNIDIINSIALRKPDLKFVLLCTSDDLSKAESIANTFPDKIFIYPITNDIFEIFAIISLSKMVITPDTAIVHIASACNRPVLMLCTTLSHAADWAPFRVQYRQVIVGNKMPLDNIIPNEVANAFVDLYDEINNSIPSLGKGG